MLGRNKHCQRQGFAKHAYYAQHWVQQVSDGTPRSCAQRQGPPTIPSIGPSTSVVDAKAYDRTTSFDIHRGGYKLQGRAPHTCARATQTYQWHGHYQGAAEQHQKGTTARTSKRGAQRLATVVCYPATRQQACTGLYKLRGAVLPSLRTLPTVSLLATQEAGAWASP